MFQSLIWTIIRLWHKHFWKKANVLTKIYTSFVRNLVKYISQYKNLNEEVLKSNMNIYFNNLCINFSKEVLIFVYMFALFLKVFCSFLMVVQIRHQDV
jgi:hypothetical protein